jgi:hypothetical protein
MEKTLLAARLDLVNASTNLALARKRCVSIFALHAAERRVCEALDRVWALQCMVEGVRP